MGCNSGWLVADYWFLPLALNAVGLLSTYNLWIYNSL